MAGLAESARAAVADDVSSNRAALEEVDVSDDQIRTTAFSNQTERQNGSVTYHARHAFELRVLAEAAGSVVDTAVTSGATRVNRVRFSHTEDGCRGLRTDTIERALDTACADADVIAGAMGVEVRSVQAVTTADGGVAPVIPETTSRDGTGLRSRSGLRVSPHARDLRGEIVGRNDSAYAPDHEIDGRRQLFDLAVSSGTTAMAGT